MEIKLEKGFIKKLKSKIHAYEFTVGVLNDGPHMAPKHTSLYDEPDLGTYAGGPVRKKSREQSGLTIGQVLTENMSRYGTNFLVEPFLARNNADITKFANQFLKTAFAEKGNPKRIENLLQAIVRNPILRGDYGANSSSTADAKGFSRFLIDTGQLFKAIKAKVHKRSWLRNR